LIGLNAGPSTYSYVENNPIVGIDRFGLYTWRGTVTSLGASLYLGAIKYNFTFTSECVDGERYTVTGFAGGPIIGVGGQAGASWARIVARDGRNAGKLDPTDFRGYSTFFGANVRLNRGPGVGGGHFGKVFWSSKQLWGSPETSGAADVSIFFGAGTSVIESISRDDCK
jgi:hypothetical protein